MYSANQARNFLSRRKKSHFNSILNANIVQEKCRLFQNDISSIDSSSFSEGSDIEDDSEEEENSNKGKISNENLEIIKEIPEEKEENDKFHKESLSKESGATENLSRDNQNKEILAQRKNSQKKSLLLNKDSNENNEFVDLQISKKIKKFDSSSNVNTKINLTEESSSKMILLDPLNIQSMKKDKNRKKSSNISLSSSIITSLRQRKSYQNVL